VFASYRGLGSGQATTGLVMVLPAVLLLGLFLVYPVLNSVYISLTSWDLVSPPRYIGLRNYFDLAEDSSFLSSAWISTYYTLAHLVTTLPVSLGLAMLLDREIRGRGVYQAIIFTPVVLSMVAVAMIWRVVYAPVGGLYLMFTTPFGISNINWLNNSTLAMPAVIIASLWKDVGYYLVIFLAGLQTIPSTYYEAARIDGAGSWHLFRYVTLPLLKPFLLFVTVVAMIKTAQAFSLIFALTNGGPADATKVLPYLIYENAFGFNQMGYASAIAIVMFIVLVMLTLIQFRALRTQY
jgi:ABC-type sugar transport system permease subunit